jgi:Holliday junction resolvasome RuvABC endonuclease subunit
MVRGERPVLPVVGLDLSLTATGICVLDEEDVRFETVGYGLKRSSRQKDKIERIIEIVSAILGEVETCIPMPAVGIEGYAFGARGAQNDLGELHGAVKTQLWLAHQIEPVIIPASHARKSVLGKGNLAKQAIVDLLTNRGIDVRNNNEADAYVIAKCLQLKVEKGEPS